MLSALLREWWSTNNSMWLVEGGRWGGGRGGGKIGDGKRERKKRIMNQVAGQVEEPYTVSPTHSHC